MWATPGAVYDQMSNGTWYFKEFDRQGGTMTSVYTYPCLSFLSEVTYENREICVEAVSYQHLYAHTGTYKIALRQGMRSEVLKGITNVGIELRESSNGKK